MRKEVSKKKTMNKKLPMIIMLVVLALVLIVVIVFAMKGKEEGSQVDNEPSTSSDDLEKWQEGIVSYNGKEYIFNQDIDAYLIMGIDKEGKVETAPDHQSGGQSDAMFLLVANADDKTMSVISINRNTITRIETYYKNGISSGYTEGQICVQHGFGDGRQLSCTRTVDAVSYLFYNLPIDGYLSMRMDAIPIMTDTIGGVELTVLEDIDYPSKGVSLKAGETKALSGNEAYCYLRGRELDEFNSATDRLRRQEQFIGCFVDQMETYTAGSTSKMLDVYESIEDYVVTNIDFANLASKLSGYTYDSSRMYTIPGEAVMGDEFEEYHVDEENFYKLIIDIFYQEVVE